MANQPETPSCKKTGVKGGYWLKELADRVPISSIPSSCFTHIFYASVLPDATNSYELHITETDEQLRSFTDGLRKKTPQIKSLLSIGGHCEIPNPANSLRDIFSSMASNPETRKSFIDSSISVARKYGFDGLDLDWEFPRTPEDMDNLGLLFEEWRTAIGNDHQSDPSGKPRLLLTAAVYFASSFFLDNTKREYPIDAINRCVDFVGLRCYDYHGSWDTSVTGEHSCLYDNGNNSQLNTSHGISTWKCAGLFPWKLVMGLPFYGRSWKLKDQNEYGVGVPAVGIGPGPNGVMRYYEIVDFILKHKAAVQHDLRSRSMYAYAGLDWVGYDDLQSIQEKLRFANAENLGGYFLWALAFDTTDGRLTHAASNAFGSG